MNSLSVPIQELSVRVKMAYGLLRELDPYVTDWTVFKTQLDNFFSANRITNEEEKRALLLNTVNQETYRLLLTVCHPSKPETTPFDALLSLLDHQFGDSLFLKRFEFFNASRDAGESLEGWISRVKTVARECDFGPDLDELCKRVFLGGLNSPGLFELLAGRAGATFEAVVDFVLKNRGLVDEQFGYCGEVSCHQELSHYVFCAMESYYYDPYHYLR